VKQKKLIHKILPADMKTPVLAMLQLAETSRYHFLLESVENGANRGRYSIIGLDPDIIWKCQNGAVNIETDRKKRKVNKNPLASLRELINESRMEIPLGIPPMASGIFGYMSYDMVRLMENIGADEHPDEIAIPDGIFIRPKILVVFDSVRDEIWIISPVRQSGGERAAEKRIGEVIALLDKPVKSGLKNFLSKVPASAGITAKAWEKKNPGYEKVVKTAKEYILAGDIFQVVLSERRAKKLEKGIDAFAVYRALRSLNPSPYLFYLHMGNFTLIGSSPEILVKCEEGKVTIRPLAGTRKRGKTTAEDLALERELLADPKETAEHLMLLDLGRNDVGRVAKPGTVKVTERMVIERYAHVMHIVSNVEGELRDDLDPLDALIAGFPAGTVSGAPKIRAMQIINELEKKRRGFYGGCVGYFSGNGAMDSCITLRTALIKDGILYSQAGAGIVADSVPETEWQECCNKAKSIIIAAETAGRYKN